ncbi:MAG: aminodeoxychorismate lyase [Actinomycetota bacterium]|nr:aminodeoxychorismate lyase [Actinomycetota bacterium]
MDAGYPHVVGRLLDGVPELLAPGQPQVSAFDLGLIRGDGIFESLLVRHGAVRGLSAHLSRLERSADLLGLPAPDRSAWASLAAACADGWPPEADGVLKLVLTRGLDGRAGPPTCLATLAPVPEETLRQRRQGVGVRVLSLGVTSDERARSPWLLGGAKSLSYAVHMAALRHAQAAGADDAVFVSADGLILEGPTSTVVWATGRSLHTPPLDSGILAGTTQADLFDHAQEAGWATSMVPTIPADLVAADAVWLVSSVRGAAAVTSIDGAARGDAGLTPTVHRLLDLIDDSASPAPDPRGAPRSGG